MSNLLDIYARDPRVRVADLPPSGIQIIEFRNSSIWNFFEKSPKMSLQNGHVVHHLHNFLMASQALRRLSSIGFSGAGFLTVYHLGVAQCLVEHGLLSMDDNKSTILTGVSGGALVSTALACGITPEDGVQVSLDVAKAARQNTLNIYHPGYSLIDAMESVFRDRLLEVTQQSDPDLDRLRGGRLRIGVTDVRVFPPLGYNPRAYRYVDTFTSVHDIVAACVLSSYVPGVTGPLVATGGSNNQAVLRSQERLNELSRKGLVKDAEGQPVEAIKGETTPPVYVDGGFVNVFPVVDEKTLIVTPLSAHFKDYKFICPQNSDSTTTSYYSVNPYSRLAFHSDNVWTLKDMVWSSELLQHRFAQGYDDAKDFLTKNNMLSSVKVSSAGTAQS